MTSKLDRPAPPYVQIATALRARILSGELKPGDRVPSVRSLVREYQVAMATAQRAVATVRAEGYIRPEPGIGSVVTTEEERGRASSDIVERTRRTGRVYPEGQHAVITKAGMAKATLQVAGALGVQAGSPVIRRDRVTYVGETPVSASSSWFPAEYASFAPKLLERERIREGTFAYVATVSGRELGFWLDQYDLALATKAEARRLDIPAGSPVARGRNWIYDDQGEVLEYGESVSAGRISYRGDMRN
jgi:DNA-binding GntR family transcriptional regulator